MFRTSATFNASFMESMYNHCFEVSENIMKVQTTWRKPQTTLIIVMRIIKVNRVINEHQRPIDKY